MLAAAAWAQEAPPSAEEIERLHAREMLAVRRVYVDRLSAGPNSGALRDMIIAALHRSRLFIVTEDESRADAYLRGAAEDLVFTETRNVRDGLQVRAAGSAGRRDRRESDSVSAGVSVGEQEDRYTREQKHEAVASLRLVARHGDVLWSTTQESLGAKYKGSSADVADKVARDLEAAWARAKKLAGAR
jgi:hypothetical protein